MLSIPSTSLSVANAMDYFETDDYYLPSKGEWHGSIAQELKLTHNIDKEDFEKLLGGFNLNGAKLVASAGSKDICDPKTGKLKRHGHNAGNDLTFSAPKSVSLMALADHRITYCFDKAIQQTLSTIESQFAQTRVREKNGKAKIVKTEKLLWATFGHETSRELDPQLHQHCLLLNMTQQKNGKFSALHNNTIIKNKLFLGQMFRNNLSIHLQEIGYSINVTDEKKGFFELKGVNRDLIEAFSSRRKQIKDEIDVLKKIKYDELNVHDLHHFALENCMKRLNGMNKQPSETEIADEMNHLRTIKTPVYSKLSDMQVAQMATLNTRIPKKNITHGDLLENVGSILRDYNTSLEEIKNDCEISANSNKSPAIDTSALSDYAKSIVQHAVSSNIEGQSVFNKINILKDAMRLSLGKCNYTDVDNAFNDLVNERKIQKLTTKVTKFSEEDLFSTPDMINIEKKVISMCQSGRGMSSTYVDSKETKKFIYNTDIALKMSSTFSLREEDPVLRKANIQKIISSINDSSIQSQIIKLNKKLTSTDNRSWEDVVKIAIENPHLHPIFEKFGRGFTAGQKEALELIASTKDVVSVIQGDAGTGKSFSMLYAKKLLEEKGFKVRGLSPTGKATVGLAESAKFNFEDCCTIDKFLMPTIVPSGRGTCKGEVWIVDESGMCGSRKFAQLISVAQETEAKIVFVGDRKQFQSIEAGRMFSELQDKAGISMVTMPDVIRQKTSQTIDIVKHISLKNYDFAFNAIKGYRENTTINKTDNSEYRLNNKLYFKNTGNDFDDTECSIVSVSQNSIAISYFDDVEQRFKETNINMSKVNGDITVFDTPSNSIDLDPYAVGDTITLPVGNKNVSQGTYTIESVSLDHLVLKANTGSHSLFSIDPRSVQDNMIHTPLKPLSDFLIKYDNMIEEISEDELLVKTANSYIDSIKSVKVENKKNKTILIAGTNKDRIALNNLIRPELVKLGRITKSKMCTVRSKVNISGISAKFTSSYKIGQKVEIASNISDVNGLIHGESEAPPFYAEVCDAKPSDGIVTFKYRDPKTSKMRFLNLDIKNQHDHITAFNEESKEFGVGEKIIFLENENKHLKISNGETGTIKKIDKHGNATILIEGETDRIVNLNMKGKGSKKFHAYNLIDHAYAITDYKSQSLTCRHLIWCASTKAQISSNSFYVAITRCTDKVSVYTNDTEGLQKKVAFEQLKSSTLDHDQKYMVQNQSFEVPLS